MTTRAATNQPTEESSVGLSLLGEAHQTVHAPDHVGVDRQAPAAVQRLTVGVVREAAHVWVVSGLRVAFFALCRHVVHKTVPIFPRAKTQQQDHGTPERLKVSLLVDRALQANLAMEAQGGDGMSLDREKAVWGCRLVSAPVCARA